MKNFINKIGRKNQAILTLVVSAFFLLFTTFQIVKLRNRNAVDLMIANRVQLLSPVIGNKNQLNQIEVIKQNQRQNQPLTNQEVDQLLIIIKGPPDSILQAKAFAILKRAYHEQSFSVQQKNSILEASTLSLNSPEFLVRHNSISMLGIIKDHRSTSPLLKMLNDKDERVQKAAKKALRKLGYRSNALGGAQNSTKTTISSAHQ